MKRLAPSPPAGFSERATTPSYVVFERRDRRHPDFREELVYSFADGWSGQVPNWDDWTKGGDGDFYYLSSHGSLEKALAWLEKTYADFLEDQDRIARRQRRGLIV